MMIYLPYPAFVQCAKRFDNHTLRVQCVTILRLLRHLRHCHHTHRTPISSLAAVWRPYQSALAEYGMILAQERLNRGFSEGFLILLAAFRSEGGICYPKWLGWEPLHASHRGALKLDYERRSIRQAVARMIHAQGLRHRRRYTQLTTKNWLRQEFDLRFEDLDSYTLASLRHRMVTDHVVRVRANHYANFEEAYQGVVWPYQYVEVSEEPSARGPSGRPRICTQTPPVAQLNSSISPLVSRVRNPIPMNT